MNIHYDTFFFLPIIWLGIQPTKNMAMLAAHQPAAVSWRGLGAVYDATAVEEFFGAKPFAVLGRWRYREVVEGRYRAGTV